VHKLRIRICGRLGSADALVQEGLEIRAQCTAKVGFGDMAGFQAVGSWRAIRDARVHAPVERVRRRRHSSWLGADSWHAGRPLFGDGTDNPFRYWRACRRVLPEANVLHRETKNVALIATHFSVLHNYWHEHDNAA
jgi:hypothetical protein